MQNFEKYVGVIQRKKWIYENLDIWSRLKFYWSAILNFIIIKSGRFKKKKVQHYRENAEQGFIFNIQVGIFNPKFLILF